MFEGRDIELFTVVCRKPGMFVQDHSYSSVCAFIFGFDCANGGGALTGFTEWLLCHEDKWTNMPWFSLVRHQFGVDPDPSSPLSAIDSEALRFELANQLEAFQADLKKDGIVRVFTRYAAWLAKVEDE
jgi:hypothetical protein